MEPEDTDEMEDPMNYDDPAEEEWGETQLLRKLPTWGLKVKREDIDFEWPLPDQYAMMDPGVRIESIEFKTDCDVCVHLSSIKVNLSNGQSSPVFENSEWPHHDNHEKIEFDPSTPITAVSGFEANDVTGKI